MNGWLSSYITRLLIGSFVIFCATALAGKGSTGEAMRFCCACFMILLVLTPIARGEMPASDILTLFSAAEAEMTVAVENAQREVYEAIGEETARRIEQLPELDGARVSVDYAIDTNGAYSVTAVNVYDPVSNDSLAAEKISGITGLPRERIVFRRQ